MGLFWMGYRMARRANRRSRYRSRSSRPQRPGPLDGMPDRLIYPTFVPIALSFVAMIAGAPRNIGSGPWHVVLVTLSVVLALGAMIWFVVICVRWKRSQKRSSPSSPPPPTPSCGREPLDPSPLPLGPRRRPVNRQAPIDRPYPFRPY